MELSENEKKLMFLLAKNNYLQLENSKGFTRDVFNKTAWGLKEKKLAGTHDSDENGCEVVFLTDFGEVYLQNNPRLKTKFLTENRKWLIGVLIPILLFIVGYIVKLLFTSHADL